MLLFLLLLVIAIGLAMFLIGIIAHGLFYLLIIGIVVVVVAMLFAGVRRIGSGRRSSR